MSLVSFFLNFDITLIHNLDWAAII